MTDLAFFCGERLALAAYWDWILITSSLFRPRGRWCFLRLWFAVGDEERRLYPGVPLPSDRSTPPVPMKSEGYSYFSPPGKFVVSSHLCV